MTKSEVIADVTRLVNGSSSLREASSYVDDYFNAITTLESLAKWVEINDPQSATMRSAKDEKESEGFKGFGGGSFGGGGASGSW